MSSRDFGRYALIKKLATGGMAEVYLARQKGLEGFEKLLVLKRILPHLADDAEFVQMFLNEARIAARFNHPNIVQIYDLGKQDDTYFIAMEFVHGEDMGRVMRKCWSKGHWIPQPLALLIIARVCEALHYAHTKTDENGTPLKVIHRDISPQNILVSFDGAVKLVDFGIARAADSAATTRSGALKGKFAYMAPEQAQNKPIDHRTDIFATGLVLYEFLTGVRPFKRESDIATLQAVMECNIRPPSEVAGEVPPALDAVTMKALARVTDDRYPDGRSFQLAIEEFLVREQWAASSVHLSEFVKQLFADRLAQEAELGRPDPDSMESGSGSAPRAQSPLPPLLDSREVHAVVFEAPSSPTVPASGPVGPPGVVSRAPATPPPTASPGGTTMNPVPVEDDEPTMEPADFVAARTEMHRPRRPTRGSPEPTPVSGTGRGIAEPTRIARKSGEVPRADSGSGNRALPGATEPQRTGPDWKAPAGEALPPPIAEASTRIGPSPDDDEPTESTGGETAALRKAAVAEVGTRILTPGGTRKSGQTPLAARGRTSTGNGAPKAGATPSRTVAVAEPTPASPKRTSGVGRRPATVSPPVPVPAIEEEPSVSVASEVSGAQTARQPDKRAIVVAVALAACGLGVLLFSPQIASWLQKGSGTIVSMDPAFLTVQSDPPGLDLYVNDRLLGRTPVMRAKIPSNETLSVKLESDSRGIHWAHTYRASPGEELKAAPSFSIGKVIVRLADRRAARIFIDNQLVGLCDGLDVRCAQIEHPAGNYRLRLEDDSSGELMRGEVDVKISPNRTTETPPVKLHVVKDAASGRRGPG